MAAVTSASLLLLRGGRQSLSALRRSLPAASSLLSLSFAPKSPVKCSHFSCSSALSWNPIQNRLLRGFGSATELAETLETPAEEHDRFNFAYKEHKPRSLGIEEIGGCDFEHWLVVVDFPKAPRPSSEEMIRFYEETCAKALNLSLEDAKKKIYGVSTSNYTGFHVEASEIESEKFKGQSGVCFVLPDSYVGKDKKEYGGDKYINGIVIPRPRVTFRERLNRDDFRQGKQIRSVMDQRRSPSPSQERSSGQGQKLNHQSQYSHHEAPRILHDQGETRYPGNDQYQPNYGPPDHSFQRNYGPPVREERRDNDMPSYHRQQVQESYWHRTESGLYERGYHGPIPTQSFPQMDQRNFQPPGFRPNYAPPPRYQGGFREEFRPYSATYEEQYIQEYHAQRVREAYQILVNYGYEVHFGVQSFSQSAARNFYTQRSFLPPPPPPRYEPGFGLDSHYYGPPEVHHSSQRSSPPPPPPYEEGFRQDDHNYGPLRSHQGGPRSFPPLPHSPPPHSPYKADFRQDYHNYGPPQQGSSYQEEENSYYGQEPPTAYWRGPSF